jgi:argininosuccinate lyase
VIEFVFDLSLIAVHLSGWAEEWILWTTTEFGFLDLPDAFCTGSSIMPHKKNPDVLELTRGKSARVVASLQQLLMLVKGLPLAYNKDLQETQEPLFDSSDTLLQMLPLVVGWMKAVEFNSERMMNAAESGFMNAWAGATYLVKRGVPSRHAHERIGKAVQMCIERNCELRDLPLEELKALSPAFDQDFYESLKLAAVLAVHDVPGGTAPSRVRNAISITRKRVESLREEVHAHA